SRRESVSPDAGEPEISEGVGAEARSAASNDPREDQGASGGARDERGRWSMEGLRSHRALFGALIVVAALIGFAITGIYIFLPFLTPLLLALIFASVTYPLYESILRRVGTHRRRLASALTCATWIVIVLVPLAWTGITIADDARIAIARITAFVEVAASEKAVEHLRDGEIYPEYWEVLEKAFAELREGPEASEDDASSVPDPGAGAPDIDFSPDAEEVEIAELDAGELDGEATGPGSDESFRPPVGSFLQLAGWASRRLGRLLVGAIGLAIQLALFFCILFYFYNDGPQLLGSIRDALPVARSTQDQVYETFRSVSRSLIRGTLLTAIVQGAVAAIGFVVVGLPAALFWGVMVTISALIPIVGTTLITVPIIFSYIAGGLFWWQGAFLAVVAIFISTFDNILRPFLLEEGLKLHPLWILLSILGGVRAFGPLGVFVGPMVVVYLGTFLALVAGPAREARAAARSSA